MPRRARRTKAPPHSRPSRAPRAPRPTQEFAQTRPASRRGYDQRGHATGRARDRAQLTRGRCRDAKLAPYVHENRGQHEHRRLRREQAHEQHETGIAEAVLEPLGSSFPLGPVHPGMTAMPRAAGNREAALNLHPGDGHTDSGPTAPLTPWPPAGALLIEARSTTPRRRSATDVEATHTTTRPSCMRARRGRAAFRRPGALPSPFPPWGPRGRTHLVQVLVQPGALHELAEALSARQRGGDVDGTRQSLSQRRRPLPRRLQRCGQSRPPRRPRGTGRVPRRRVRCSRSRCGPSRRWLTRSPCSAASSWPWGGSSAAFLRLTASAPRSSLSASVLDWPPSSDVGWSAADRSRERCGRLVGPVHWPSPRPLRLHSHGH